MIANIVSLFLGLLAWGLGFAAVAKRGKPVLVFCSLGACALSLVCQLVEVRRLAAIHDWSAVEDTIGAVTFAGIVLLAVTAALNLIALMLRHRPAHCS